MPWWWPFGKKKQTPSRRSAGHPFGPAYEAELKNLEQYYLEQKRGMDQAISRGVPRQQLEREARNKALEFTRMHTPKELVQAVALDRIAAELEQLMFSRLSEAGKAEKEGRIDDAILLYEACVKDQCIGGHANERLRVIYRKRKQFDQAIRVCEAAVNNPYLDERSKAKMKEWADKMKSGQ